METSMPEPSPEPLEEQRHQIAWDTCRVCGGRIGAWESLANGVVVATGFECGTCGRRSTSWTEAESKPQARTATISNNTIASLWSAAAAAINMVKADELEVIAAELRAKPALRGVPATVDARWLEARAARLRGEEQT